MTQSDVFDDCAPIFVVGAPRSGTTLLERMLGAHPAIAIAYEITYFDIVLKARRVVPELDSAERIEKFFALLPAMDHVRYWNHADEVLATVKARLLADEHASYSRFYRYFMEACAARSGARRFGEKTPWNVRHLEDLQEMFPRCRILHVVRDPRAVVASKRALPNTSTDVLTNALKWLIDVEQARRFLSSDPRNAETMLEVRYEDLVSSPEAALRRICAFIGEPFDERMLEYAETRDVMFRNQAYHAGVFQPVFKSSLDAWRQTLNGSQVLMIEMIAASLMAFYGYEPARRSLTDRVGIPLQLLRELRAWRAFKRAERQLHENEPEIQFRSDADLQYRLLWDVVRRRLHVAGSR